MDSQTYPLPAGVHAIPAHLLDLRPDSEVDHDLLHPKPISDEKNIWFFWHTGFTHMHPYTQRNIRAWHRRFSRQGWTIRVINRLPSSPLNVANFLDISDPDTFPQAFIDGTIGGDYAPQHTSDLVRFPLLLQYGGVYADVGMIQIGDLDRLWHETVGNPASRFEVLAYNAGSVEERDLTNYFLVSGRNNPFFARSHKLLLQLWAADGGKTSTEGMHSSPLLEGVPLMEPSVTIEDGEGKIGAEELNRMLSDYIIQGQVMTMVMGLVDEEDGWDGPKYVVEHVYAIDYMVGSQLINEFTAWNGQKAFDLMSLLLPKEGEEESADQKQAREIVETCLKKSFGFKLAHGLILRVLGPTLGSLWRKHEGSDDVLGTYAHWFRHGTVYWEPEELPLALDFKAWHYNGQESVLDARYRQVGEEKVEDVKHATTIDMNKVDTTTRGDPKLVPSIWQEHHAVLEALQEEQPHAILRAFLEASENSDYLQMLPATTLAEILRAIDPSYFLDQYKDVFHDFQTYRVMHLPKDIRSLKQVFANYRKAIQLILSRWRRLGRSFGITEYRSLLNIARAVGDGKTAMAIFDTMRLEQVQPDTLCYNYLLEARSWSNGYDPFERWRLRVIPRNMDLRQTGKNQKARGFLGYEAGYRGIRDETFRIFDQMRMAGITTDVNTFGQLMLGMGREGDIEGVKSVLKRIWDVQVDSILREDDSALLFENDLSPSSPLYPNEHLLFIIAHIFCTNSQLPTALRVVDVFSRKYAVEIDIRTWAELFEWTFVLATRRYGKAKNDGSEAGQLPLASVENLWATMVSEPYNIKPTMPMYNRRIRALWKGQRYDEMLVAMEAGRKLHKFQQRRLRRKLDNVQRPTQKDQYADDIVPGVESQRSMASKTTSLTTTKDENGLEDTDVPEPEVPTDFDAGVFMTYEKESLERARIHELRDFVMVSRWARLFMAGSRWIPSNERDLNWERIGAPDAIRKFWYYRPRPGFGYNMSTGKIQFPPSFGEPEFVFTVVRYDRSSVPGVDVVQDTRPPPTALYNAWSRPDPPGLNEPAIPRGGRQL
ncbi:hypothetical protein MMC11_004825 [Xylographa trunciseda]|nr:hypothetical protein [Xylographa trunciseda]